MNNDDDVFVSNHRGELVIDRAIFARLWARANPGVPQPDGLTWRADAEGFRKLSVAACLLGLEEHFTALVRMSGPAEFRRRTDRAEALAADLGASRSRTMT